MSQDAISAAIAQATQAAQAMPAVMAQEHLNSAAVAAYAAPTGPATTLSVDDMLSGSLDVKAWLKLSKFGINFGSDTTMFKEIPVTLDMSSVQYCYQIRYGNPAKYEKTYNHVVDVKGRPWVSVVAAAQQQDPKASEYRSADIPFVSRIEIKGEGGKVLVAPGEIIGHSLPVTGWKNFQKFIHDVRKAGIDIYTGVVDVDLKFLYQKNDKGEWGILTFENLRASA